MPKHEVAARPIRQAITAIVHARNAALEEIAAWCDRQAWGNLPETSPEAKTFRDIAQFAREMKS